MAVRAARFVAAARAGRDWQPEENEERNRILGSASRTQVGRRSAPAGTGRDSGAAEGREPRERKRKEAGPALQTQARTQR